MPIRLGPCINKPHSSLIKPLTGVGEAVRRKEPGRVGGTTLAKVVGPGGRSRSNRVGCWPLLPGNTGAGGRLGGSRKAGGGRQGSPHDPQGERELG